MADNREEKSALSFGVGVGLGLAIGTMSAVLFAPKSGGQTRQMIADFAHEVKGSAEELIQEAVRLAETVTAGTERFSKDTEAPLRKKIQRLEADLDRLSAGEA